MGDYSKRDIQDAIERTKRSCDEELAALRSELDRVRGERDEAVFTLNVLGAMADSENDIVRDIALVCNRSLDRIKQLRADTNA